MDWIKFRTCWCLPLQLLTDEEAGKVIKDAAAFIESGEEPEPGGREGLLLRRIITQLREDLSRFEDADAKKEDARARRKEAARKAADARWHRDKCATHDAGIGPALPIDIDIEKEKERDTETETEGDKDSSCSELPPAASELPVAEIPLVDGSVYPVYRDQAETYAALYPAVDVDQALRNIQGWCLSNPRKRKTRSGIRRFINAWLSRDQGRGGTALPARQEAAPYNPFLEKLHDLERQEEQERAAQRAAKHGEEGMA